MLTAFVAGVFAGYGVAIPVGAIAVLIIEMGARRGLRLGLAAGAGAASADGLYALLAAVSGVALAAIIAPFTEALRIIAVALRVAIAARGLWGLRVERRAPAAGRAETGTSPAQAPGDGAAGATVPPRQGERPGAGPTGATYARYLGLTLLNPMTVVYFGALIIGLPSTGESAAAKLAFVVGAFLASLSWQSLLAAFGAFLHRRAPEGVRLAVSVAGYLIVLGFAARIALDLMAH
ncbi:MAG: LysE family transporter [Candidatus Limnocylindrales bacterium]